MSDEHAGESQQNGTGANASAPSTPPETGVPSSRPTAWWMIVISMIAAYPLGLILLLRRPGTSLQIRILLSIVIFPIFALVWLAAMLPYWHFDGGMTASSFRLDFGRGGQSEIVENHRKEQTAKFGSIVAKPDPELMLMDWPSFRGPLRDGVVRDMLITTDWDHDPPRQIWRQPVGEGHSSFVVGNGRLYTMEQRSNGEAVTCYDIDTGREVWASAAPGNFQEPLGDNGPRATPTLDKDRLYALGAEGTLRCLDSGTGKEIWSKNILREFGASNLSWAMASSPLIVDDTVVVTNSGIGGGSIMAYRKADGSLAWKNDLGQQGYSSPMLVTVKGRRQILNLAGFNLNSLDPASGEKLWSFPWATSMGISCSQPLVVDQERIFISLGYGIGSAMIKLEGDAENLKPKELWTSRRLKNKFSSSVIHRGAIFGLDEEILCCLNLDTGELNWKGGRYGFGSLLLVGDYLLINGEDGDLILVEATPERHIEKAKMRLFDERTWNNSALVGGLLFTRNHREMACYDMRPTRD